MSDDNGCRQNPNNDYGAIVRTPHGDCTITWVGAPPERGRAFEYKDARNHFYFYASAAWEGSSYDLKIEHATIEKFHGPKPQINPADLDAIKAAIRTFFVSRWYMDASRPRPAEEHLREILYSWHVES